MLLDQYNCSLVRVASVFVPRGRGGSIPDFKWRIWSSGATKPKKIPRASNKTKNKTLDQKWIPKKYHAESPRKDCNLFTQLRGRDIRAIAPGNFHEASNIFECPQKNPHTKKYLPTFPTQKIPGISNPKNSFHHPVSLPEYPSLGFSCDTDEGVSL